MVYELYGLTEEEIKIVEGIIIYQTEDGQTKIKFFTSRLI